ncbi:hypothetical protein Q5752_003366 [Cryptotrichosporon argae]
MNSTLDLRPGRGAGPFRISDTLWQVIDYLRAHHGVYPKFSLSWDTAEPQNADITLRLPHLTLFFRADQRLAWVDIPHLVTAPLTLTYDRRPVSAPSRPLTRGGVAKFLGPTHASDKGRLSYPGISFWVQDEAGRDGAVMALRVERRDAEDVKYGDDEHPDGLASCMILPNEGVTVRLPTHGPADAPHDFTVEIGRTMAQDLMMELGAPVRDYFKEDDRLQRMWGCKGGGGRGQTEVFWNYANLGLDFLVVGELVDKIVVHSNIPGTPLFQQYARCPWSLPTDNGQLTASSSIDDFGAHFGSPAPAANGQAERRANGKARTTDGKANGKIGRAKSAASDEQDDEPPSTVAPRQTKHEAMVLDRTVEGGLEGVLGVGPSRLVGYKGLVVEEDQDSGAICSVLVFKE